MEELKSTEPLKEANVEALKEIKKQKKAIKAINKGVENFSEKKSDSYWKDVEHNINARCSIRESSDKSKAYRKQRNDIYAHLREEEEKIKEEKEK